MSNIMTRQTTAASNISGKVTNRGSALTNAEMDNNLVTLNNEKVESNTTSSTNGAVLAFNGASGKQIRAATAAEIVAAIGTTAVAKAAEATSASTATSATSATTATMASMASTANALDPDNSYRVESLGVGTVASDVAGEIRATNDITAYYSSDRRLKKSIKAIKDPIGKLMKLTGVTFKWRANYIRKRGGRDDYFMREDDVGVIAQDVQAVLPELVGERPDGTLAVKYDRIVALLIEVNKHQQDQIAELRLRIEKLEG